jgi:hypothetical protein
VRFLIVCNVSMYMIFRLGPVRSKEDRSVDGSWGLRFARRECCLTDEAIDFEQEEWRRRDG